MSIWRRMLSLTGLRPKSDSRTYTVSESMQVTPTTLAQHEGRPEHELANDLLVTGLFRHYSFDHLLMKWETLSAREHDAAAHS
jgi:hypothetical protein